MKPLRLCLGPCFALLVALLCTLLSGCASGARFGVNAIVSPTMRPATGTFAIVPPPPMEGETDDAAAEVLAAVRAGLLDHGWVEASPGAKADFIVEYRWAMGPRSVSKSVTSFPITQQVANPANVSTAINPTYQNPGITSIVNATTGQRGVSMEPGADNARGPAAITVPAGEETFVSVRRVVRKRFSLSVAPHPEATPRDGRVRPTWVKVENSDGRTDAARYLRIMVAVALEAIDRSERGYAEFRARERDGQIVVKRR